MTCQHSGNTLSSPFLTPPLTRSSVYTELWTGDAQKVIDPAAREFVPSHGRAVRLPRAATWSAFFLFLLLPA